VTASVLESVSRRRACCYARRCACYCIVVVVLVAVVLVVVVLAATAISLHRCIGRQCVDRSAGGAARRLARGPCGRGDGGLVVCV
jgi:hypothetical protein